MATSLSWTSRVSSNPSHLASEGPPSPGPDPIGARLTDSESLPAFFGGNSTKATSGINGALTRTQVENGIQDSVKQFYDDTLKSARDKARPDLIKVLTYKSAAAVEWLQDVFNLDLTLVSRLG